MSLLEVNNLSAGYLIDGEPIPVLHDIHLTIEKGESVGLIGESGSGKSTLSEVILKTLSYKGGEVTNGKVSFEGIDLSHPEIEIVGKDIAYIPQDPNSSFDPLCPVMQSFEEIIEVSKKSHLSTQTNRTTVDVLEIMGKLTHGIDLSSYPHQLSGGMRQRVLMGAALQTVPKLIIADEPTSNLDVSLERKVIDLFKELKEKQNISFLFTTHNLVLARYFCDRIYVLYKGKIVESGSADDIFNNPKDNYTIQLINSIN